MLFLYLTVENRRPLAPIIALQTNRGQENVPSYSDPPTYEDLYKCHCNESNKLNCRFFLNIIIILITWTFF